MNKLAIAVLALLVPAEGIAAQRLTTTRLACERVQGIVRQEGARVMYWQSQRVPGLPRYDRLVRDSHFCDDSEYAIATTVPTSDDPKCLVKHCVLRLDDDGTIFRTR